MRKFFLCMLLMTLLWVGSARMDEKCAAACSIADLGRVQECSARVRPRLKLNSLRGGAGAVATRIILDDSACSSCEVVGSWNAWAERIPMTKIAGTTVYEATIPMSPGKHVFKFVKDGVTWECSPDIQKETDASGNENNVITVAEPAKPAAPALAPTSAPAPVAKPPSPSAQEANNSSNGPAAGSTKALSPTTPPPAMSTPSTTTATATATTKFAPTGPPLKVGTYALARPSSSSRQSSRASSAGPSRSRTPASRTPASRSPAPEPRSEYPTKQPGMATASVVEQAAAKLAAKERPLGAGEDNDGKLQGGFLGMASLAGDGDDTFSSSDMDGKSPSIQRENNVDGEFGKRVLEEAVDRLDEMLKGAREKDMAASGGVNLDRNGEMSRDEGDRGVLRDSLLKSQEREEEANKQVDRLQKLLKRSEKMVQHLSALVHESQQYGYLPGPVEGQEARTRKQERPAAQGSKPNEGFFFGAVKKVSMGAMNCISASARTRKSA